MNASSSPSRLCFRFGFFAKDLPQRFAHRRIRFPRPMAATYSAGVRYSSQPFNGTLMNWLIVGISGTVWRKLQVSPAPATDEFSRQDVRGRVHRGYLRERSHELARRAPTQPVAGRRGVVGHWIRCSCKKWLRNFKASSTQFAHSGEQTTCTHGIPKFVSIR